jgi:Glycine rich protein
VPPAPYCATSGAGGFNGGGNGGTGISGDYANGTGGGGASDVLEGGDALADRVLVAGGGGETNGGYGAGKGGGGGGIVGVHGAPVTDVPLPVMAAKGARNNAVVKAGAAVSATAATSRAAKDIAACLVLGAMAGVRQELAAVEVAAGAVVSTAAAEVAEARGARAGLAVAEAVAAVLRILNLAQLESRTSVELHRQATAASSYHGNDVRNA